MPDANKLAQAFAALNAYPLAEAIRNRRSRRFSAGARLTGKGLGHVSALPPQPLCAEEEAVLALAAAGINGFCLSDLPMDGGGDPEGGGGNVMAALTGRTIASADAVHATALFVINDEATVMMRRPQDFTMAEIAALAGMAGAGRIAEAYQMSRLQIARGRTEIERQVPNVLPFNKWSTNLPGSTYFLPVSDLTGMYINVLLSSFDDDIGYYIVDERNNLRGAGIRQHSKKRGGWLHNDFADRRIVPINLYETMVLEFIVAEQAFMCHNLSLMEQAMGLGGWTHFAASHDTVWPEALGFRMGSHKASQYLRAGRLKRLLMKALGKDVEIPIALGLTLEGTDLIKPYCPPYYANMEEAVLAFLADKKARFVEIACGEDAPGTWKNPAAVQSQIPWFSDRTIQATIDYCTYVHTTYGRFPAHYGPIRTTLAHQAHHLDLGFYDTHYRPGAYTQTQARHNDLWHAGG